MSPQHCYTLPCHGHTPTMALVHGRAHEWVAARGCMGSTTCKLPSPYVGMGACKSLCTGMPDHGHNVVAQLPLVKTSKDTVPQAKHELETGHATKA